jgi:hypothetical protein
MNDIERLYIKYKMCQMFYLAFSCYETSIAKRASDRIGKMLSFASQLLKSRLF